MIQPIREHQIEQILLRAHIEKEAGVDLIEGYFLDFSSLDPITMCARNLLQQEKNPEIQSIIVKNLSECIVVKLQREKYSFLGMFRKVFMWFGFAYKNSEITRAENLIQQVSTSFDPLPSNDVSSAE